VLHDFGSDACNISESTLSTARTNQHAMRNTLSRFRTASPVKEHQSTHGKEMASNILVLTGAPEPQSLKWDECELLDTFGSHLSGFLGLPQPSYPPDGTHPRPSDSGHAAWRSLNLTRQHLATGYSQVCVNTEAYRGDTAFFSKAYPSFTSEAHSSGPDTQNPSSTESVEEILSQYYEHSFAVHANIPSSQISPKLGDGTSSKDDQTSFSTDISSQLSSSVELPRRLPVPAGGHLSDLEDIPNAAYLNSIQPQTMTVNLIVGVISISEPRSIRTRHGAPMEIVEMLVGDETKSGFEVNFWLPAVSNAAGGGPNNGNLRGVLACFRPQDIVLLRNVALSSFRGKVLGQSLRKEMTKAHLLYRNRIDSSDIPGCYTTDDLEMGGQDVHPQILKTRLVREWVLRFVGLGSVRKIIQGKVEMLKEVLPPDTQ
jgi:hypothetical protein